jgi:restriction system protein
MAIQCKRYSRTNKITAEPIRSLSGVLDRYQAHAGVVATTSFFTEPAVMEARSHIWKVGLQDYDDIVAGLMKLKIDGTAP